MSGRIEAWLYSSGTADEVESTASFTVTEPGPVTYRAVLPGALRLTDALTSWQASLNAGASGLAGTYTIAWDASAQAVTISATGVASFDVTFHGSVAAVLGFSGDVSGALSYTGDQQALTRFDGLRVSADAIASGDSVDLREYAHGRHRAIAWGAVDVWPLRVHVQNERRNEFLASYCVGGKVRVWQDETVSTAYSITNLCGYVDGYVIGLANHSETRGRVWTLVDLTLAVPRS